MAVVLIQTWMSKEVPDAGIGSTVEVNIPVDSTQTPLVLILQVGAITELMNLTRQQILTGADIGSDIKLGRALVVLVEADLLTVYIDNHEVGAPLKMKEDAPTIPVFRNGESVAVATHR